MVNIKVENVGGRLQVTSPYHPRLPKLARDLGGKWSGERWVFDARDEQRVRDMLIEVYGTDGSPAVEEQAKVTLLVDLDKLGRRADAQTLWIAGREVAHRMSRDYAVRLGDGVSIVSGGFFGSGGSAKNPRLQPRDGTVLRVRDVLERAAASDLCEAITLETAPDEAQRERERLLARAVELRAELQAVEAQLAALSEA